MAEFKFNEAWEQFRKVIAEMSLVKRASILVTIFASLSVLGLLYQLAEKSNYEVLFSSLKTEDIGQIASALDKYKIPYQVQSDTQSILVPGEKVLETRLKLSKDGLPRFGGAGFEIFDQKSFGMTEFEQRLNYQRALQGELVRTINGIQEIEDTRVHLVIPEKTIFSQSREAPSASVVLKIAQGQSLQEGTIQSIVHLVSASVPNLDSKNVTVVDTTGQLLTQESDDSNVEVARKKQDIEKSFEEKVRTLLEPIIGMGKVRVKVTADLDFTSKETTQEKYDPDSIAVRSEKRTKSSETNSDGSSGGVVGTTAQKTGGSGSKGKSDQNESFDYEVSKEVQHTIAPVGEIRKLSVAVIVDGVTTTAEDGTTQYAARGPEEVKNYEDLIKSAIGFQADRGDQIKVMNLAFQNLDQLFVQDKPSFWQRAASEKSSFSFALGVMTEVIIALIAILLVVFVVRPMVTAFLERRALAGQGSGFSGMMRLDAAHRGLLPEAQLKDEIQKQAIQDPDGMVSVLRSWMS